MSVKQISPIVLAAGQSSRFGSDKLLHPVTVRSESRPLILQALSPWLEVFAEINVVVRKDNTALLRLLADCDESSQLRLIPAAAAHQGMSQSLIAGIRANSDADGWLIGLADMPYLKRGVIADCLAAMNAGSAITLPEFEGRRGHPVGFDYRFLPQLLALTGDSGAREIIHSSQTYVCSISAGDEGIFRDIDMKDDIQQSS